MVAVGVGKEGAFVLCPMKQVGAGSVPPGLVAHGLFHWVVLPEVLPGAFVVDHAIGVVIEPGLLREVELRAKGFFVELFFARNVICLLDLGEAFFGGAPCSNRHFLALEIFEAERGIPVNCSCILGQFCPIVADRLAIDEYLYGATFDFKPVFAVSKAAFDRFGQIVNWEN